MVRKSTEQRAFEKSRKDILKLSDKEVGKEEEQKYAWEIELEEYRNRSGWIASDTGRCVASFPF